ncbi:hypothetical protein PspLS_06316 [Pyricularia sp. CBS 133598]|nr:hypothetical protein PspLS_06316 [Pyricularia sp. CBS 133598]
MIVCLSKWQGYLSCANTTYKLIRVLSDTRGACIKYQEAMPELCAMQQAFIQVSQMSSDRSGLMPRATVKSASFISYRAQPITSDVSPGKMRRGISGSIEGSWCKVGWTLFKKDELRELRDLLHARLASINTLLSAAHQWAF